MLLGLKGGWAGGLPEGPAASMPADCCTGRAGGPSAPSPDQGSPRSGVRTPSDQPASDRPHGDGEEAERQVRLIINPPTANVGEVYDGRVVNITKFGAFVNILPGTDGLLHISKIGGGKRIDKVEDVLNLGDVIAVKVDDIDPNGKLSLSLAGDAPAAKEPASDDGDDVDDDSDDSDAPAPSRSRSASADRDEVSFEEAFDAQAAEKFGDLGPSVDTGRRTRGRQRRGRSRR